MKKRENRLEHTNPKESGEFECVKCSKTFRKKHLLAVHKYRKHSPNYKANQRAKCQLCEKSYSSATYLKEHVLKDHEKNTPFACEFCSQKFGVESILRCHIVNTHQKVKCDECNQEICNGFMLRRHKAKMHGTKSKTSYQCEFCPYVYEQKTSLEKHVAKNHSNFVRQT